MLLVMLGLAFGEENCKDIPTKVYRINDKIVYYRPSTVFPSAETYKKRQLESKSDIVSILLSDLERIERLSLIAEHGFTQISEKAWRGAKAENALLRGRFPFTQQALEKGLKLDKERFLKVSWETTKLCFSH